MRIEGHFQLDLNLLHTHPMSLEYGTILGQALFSAKIKDAFLQALATSGNALCVLLCIEADELKSLHWQSLCGPLDNQWSYLALNQRTLFSHYLPAATDRRFPLIERSDLRGLAIVASPTGLDGYGLTPFNVAETVAYLRSSFGSIPLDILADTTDTVGAPTLDAFCAQIVAKRYSLVHVVCHGAYHREEREMSLFLSWPGRGRCRRQMRRLCCPSEQKTSNKMRTPDRKSVV